MRAVSNAASTQNKGSLAARTLTIPSSAACNPLLSKDKECHRYQPKTHHTLGEALSPVASFFDR
jgi:hypothetical protein